MFNFMKKAAEKDDKEKRKREKKERKDVKKRDRSSMSAEELLRLDEVLKCKSVAGFKKYSCSITVPFLLPIKLFKNYKKTYKTRKNYKTITN